MTMKHRPRAPTSIEKAVNVQIAFVEQALRELQVHVPTDQIHLTSDGDDAFLYARGLVMFHSRINRFDTPDITVERRWIAWPPPPARKTRRSKRGGRD